MNIISFSGEASRDLHGPVARPFPFFFFREEMCAVH